MVTWQLTTCYSVLFRRQERSCSHLSLHFDGVRVDSRRAELEKSEDHDGVFNMCRKAEAAIAAGTGYKA